MSDNSENKKTEIVPAKKKCINFKEKKENTICSLYEVEHFLCDFKNVVKGVKLYKILKW